MYTSPSKKKLSPHKIKKVPLTWKLHDASYYVAFDLAHDGPHLSKRSPPWGYCGQNWSMFSKIRYGDRAVSKEFRLPQVIFVRQNFWTTFSGATTPGDVRCFCMKHGGNIANQGGSAHYKGRAMMCPACMWRKHWPLLPFLGSWHTLLTFDPDVGESALQKAPMYGLSADKHLLIGRSVRSDARTIRDGFREGQYNPTGIPAQFGITLAMLTRGH
jgi:hypothetical protein